MPARRRLERCDNLRRLERNPLHYLLAEEDKVLPPELQAQCAALAGAVVEKVKAGHMLMLSQEGRCLEVILRAAAGEGA